MANLLFAARQSDSLRSENPGMSQLSRGLVLAPSASISPSTSFSFMGLTARARWSFARSCAAASCDPQLLAFLATLPPCTVAMEACGSAHYWGREIAKLGHMVKLIAPAYVKPFVKRQKNDMADAEAICEAAQRPTMRFVALKSEQAQAAAVVFRTRSSGPPAHP